MVLAGLIGNVIADTNTVNRLASCIRAQDDNGELFASYMFKAYQYALDMGAHIVVNSFSNTYWSVPSSQARAFPFAC